MRTPEYLLKAFWWQASLLNAGLFIQVAKSGFLGIMWVVSRDKISIQNIKAWEMDFMAIKFEEIHTARREWKAKAIQLAEAKKPFALIGFDIASNQKFYDSLKKYDFNQSFVIVRGNADRACFWV